MSTSSAVAEMPPNALLPRGVEPPLAEALDGLASDGSGKTRRVTSILFYLGDELLVLGGRRFAVPLSALRAPRPAPS